MGLAFGLFWALRAPAIIPVPVDLKEPQGAGKSPFCGLQPPLGLMGSIPQPPLHTQAQETLGGSRETMPPFVLRSGCLLGALPGKRAKALLLLGLPTSGASALPRRRQHRGHWMASISQPPCTREIINIILQTRKWGPAREVLEQPSWREMVARSGPPVPELGVGLLEAPGASSGPTRSPLLLFWQEYNRREESEAAPRRPLFPFPPPRRDRTPVLGGAAEPQRRSYPTPPCSRDVS